MKLALRCLACTLVLGMTLGFAMRTRVSAQMAPMSSAQQNILAELQKDWQEQKKTMMAIADAMPAEKCDYKSTPAQRNYCEQIVHVAQANVSVLKVIGGTAIAPAITSASAKTKEDSIKALGESYDYGTALLQEQTDATIAQTVQGPRFLGPSTRARVFWVLMSHANDIYGQMVVYLRLNGIVPPASRRDM